MKTRNSGYNSKRIYRVRCKSGIIGWRMRLQNNYFSMSEFESFCRIYGVHLRLGVKNDKAATLFDLWESNPVIEGSTNPADFRKVK